MLFSCVMKMSGGGGGGDDELRLSSRALCDQEVTPINSSNVCVCVQGAAGQRVKATLPLL